MKTLRIVCLISLLISISYVSGCGGISSIGDTQKNLFNDGTRQTKQYKYFILAPTSLYNISNQVSLYNMLNELLSNKAALDQEHGRYSLIIKVLEYEKVDVLAHAHTGMFAGTDHIKTQITIVDEESIKDERYTNLYSTIDKSNLFIDPNNVESDRIKKLSSVAETLLNIPESHIFQGTVETNHKSPKWIEDTKFILTHAEEIAKFILDN